jgi:hypothetical protein
MKLRNVVTVLGTAALTTVVTLGLAALCAGGRAEAAPGVAPMIARPELTSQGCKFVLKADKATYEADETPIFEITATNTTKENIKAKVWVNVSATSPMALSLRMAPRPRILWSGEVAFSLEPGETKSQKVTCSAKLPAGQSVSVTLSDTQTAIMPMNFPTQNAGNAAQQGLNYVPRGRN